MCPLTRTHGSGRCLADAPPQDATLEETLATSFPEGCSLQYLYYSLSMRDGAAGVAPALETFLAEAESLNAELPVFDDGVSPSYFLIATTTAQEQQRVERSNQPTVAALFVLGLAAAAVTVVVLGLAVLREVRSRGTDQRQWRQLGLTVGDRVWVLAVPLLAAVAIGLLIAVPLAWLLSTVAPVGLVRAVEPDPGRYWSDWFGLGTLGLAVVCALGVVALVHHHSRRIGAVEQYRRRREVGIVSRAMAGSARPETAEGVRAAYGGNRSAGLVVASGGVAAAVLLGAVIFGTSLATVVSTPASYGWPWDLALMTGAGYGDLDVDALDATLRARDDVEGWTVLGFLNEVTIDDAPVMTVVGFDELSALGIKVVDGQLPAGPAQVALGSRTAAELGLDVGDRAELGGSGREPVPVTVTGIVVLQAVGPLNADRTAPGVGMLVPAAMGDDDTDSLATFAGIDLVPGTDREAVAELRDEMVLWDTLGEEPFRYPEPVRPAEIVNAESMRVVPMIVGATLAVTAAIGLTVAVVVSVRSRRRELAILRSLGFTGRQVRRSVRVQSVATMAGALLIGVPAGMLIGGLTWRAFAVQLGVVDDPTISRLWLLVTVVGGLAVAIVAAAGPARTAARVEPGVVLRTP